MFTLGPGSICVIGGGAVALGSHVNDDNQVAGWGRCL